MKPVVHLRVALAGRYVGELVMAPRRGLFFAYAPAWLADGFALSPLNMRFDAAPQISRACMAHSPIRSPMAGACC